MTPLNKVRLLVLMKARAWGEDDIPEIDTLTTDKAVEDAYETAGADYALQDAENDVREGEEETDIPREYDRNYESKSVAAQLPNGSWVGWTYWYGGGKHGNPEEIEWMEDAYDLTCVEETQTVVVRKFSKGKANAKRAKKPNA